MALAHGLCCAGPYHCLFCAAPCGVQHPATDYLRDSFTGRDSLSCPGSPWVCVGCVLCLRESCDVPLCDGTVRPVAKAAMRAWSWVVAPAKATAASKAHLDWLRSVCLDQPQPPFAICLSDSGQKHLLYRGVVCHDRENFVVTLEGLRVAYRPEDLSALLNNAGRLCAATGKPALSEPPDARLGMAYLERYPDGENDLETWCQEWQSPLGRLAGWLCPARERCRELYPAAALTAD